MGVWASQEMEKLNQIYEAPEVYSCSQASVRRISTSEILVVLRQPTDKETPSPFSDKYSILLCFQTTNPRSLKGQMQRRLKDVKKTWLSFDKGGSLLPVRMCDGAVQMTPVDRKYVSWYFRFEPVLTKEEWELFENRWRFQVTINYDAISIFNDEDVDVLLQRLQPMSSYYLNIESYDLGGMSVLKDKHGATISYMNDEGNIRLDSINPSIPKGKTYVRQFVDEMDEDEIEVDAHNVVSADSAMSILRTYLTSGRVSGLEADSDV